MTEHDNDIKADADDQDAPREIESADLFRGGKEVRIRHGNDVYLLRITRSNKLILQK